MARSVNPANTQDEPKDGAPFDRLSSKNSDAAKPSPNPPKNGAGEGCLPVEGWMLR
jgi:hypothetical protein